MPYCCSNAQPLLGQTVPVAGEENSKSYKILCLLREKVKREKLVDLIQTPDVPRNPILTLFGGLLFCLLLDDEELF